MTKNNYLYSLLCTLLLSLTACKSCSYSLSGINIPADVNTFSVQYFNNQASYVNPSLSQKFTEQMKDKFLRETSLTLIGQDGDFKLSGSIVDYRTESVASDPNTGSSKNRFIMTVRVVFECPKHPEMNFTENISKFQEFNATETFQSIEASLSEQVSTQIIQEVFNKVALKW